MPHLVQCHHPDVVLEELWALWGEEELQQLPAERQTHSISSWNLD